MALNIKNRRVCELAREAAERLQSTQVSVIERALERLLAEEDRLAAERLDALRAAVQRAQAALTEEDRQSLRGADEELYDHDGLYR